MSTESTSPKSQAVSLIDTLTTRKVLVRKLWNVDLPDYFPRSVDMSSLVDSINAAAPEGWTEADTLKLIAHSALSQMVINFRAQVEATARKWVDETHPIDSAHIAAKVARESWSSYFPASSGRASLTKEEKALKAINAQAAQMKMKPEELLALLTSMAKPA